MFCNQKVQKKVSNERTKFRVALAKGGRAALVLAREMWIEEGKKNKVAERLAKETARTQKRLAKQTARLEKKRLATAPRCATTTTSAADTLRCVRFLFKLNREDREKETKRVLAIQEAKRAAKQTAIAAKKAAKENAKMRRKLTKERDLKERMECVSRAKVIFESCDPSIYNKLKIDKYMRMCLVGFILNKQFSATNFTNKYTELFGETENVWTGKEYTHVVDDLNNVTGVANFKKYDHPAAIRSLLYEMSSSSCQNYFKFGKLHKTGIDCPFPFVNQKLWEKNEAFGWKKCGPGKGRATRGQHWQIDEKIYTRPMVTYTPDPRVLEDAREGRRFGMR